MAEQEHSTFVQPSIRWAARIIDFGLWTPLALIIFVPSLLMFDSIIGDLVSDASKATLTTLAISGAIFLFVLVLIDTLIGAMFGNTPGKSLMRISVTEADGSALTTSRRFKRNISVATIGYGWSVPFLGWILMLVQYFIAGKGKPTTYDKIGGFSVGKLGPIAMWRGLLCAVVFIVALSFQAISTKLANAALNPHGWYFGLQAIAEADSKARKSEEAL